MLRNKCPVSLVKVHLYKLLLIKISFHLSTDTRIFFIKFSCRVYTIWVRLNAWRATFQRTATLLPFLIQFDWRRRLSISFTKCVAAKCWLLIFWQNNVYITCTLWHSSNIYAHIHTLRCACTRINICKFTFKFTHIGALIHIHIGFCKLSRSH